MSVRRFEQMCQYLRLTDNRKIPDRNSKEFKLYKLVKITERVNECSRKGFTLNQQLNIDKQKIGTKSHISFLQYMPKNQTKFGANFEFCQRLLLGLSLLSNPHWKM